jgi:hypothetical protein
MSLDGHDDKKKYCRMLGHEIAFSYCRQGASARPCRKIFDCWFETFDIEGFMKEHFAAEELQAILAPPKLKMTSLVELIRQAQKNAEANKSGE